MNPNRFPTAQAKHRQSGMSMLEVLVAIIILSVGALGMAGLQARALKGNQSSMQRSQAVAASYYVLDAIRADRQNALNYTMGMTCVVPGGGSLVNNTRGAWLAALKETLGNDAATCGQINCQAVAGGAQCTISVRWDDTRAGGSATETLVTSSRL